MQRALISLIFVIAAAAGAYAYRDQVRVLVSQVSAYVAPCRVPLTYSIGTIDARFDISSSSLQSALDRAAAVWNDDLDRQVLRSASHGALTINLIYDDRQQTTETLATLDSTIARDRTAYETMKREYDALRAAYDEDRARFESERTQLSHDTESYQAEVSRVNARGGASPAEYARLQTTKAALAERQDALVAKQRDLNAHAAEVNAAVQRLNMLAAEVNAGASTYNEAAQGHREEFEEAVYQSAPGTQEIDVFEFDSDARLTRVLAHELGHALGLEHVEDESAIMYRLNQSTSLHTTEADDAELRAACHIRT